MEAIRLQKFLSDNGICSRRAAEKEIQCGNVSVNGKPAEIGSKVRPDKDYIEYRGKHVLPRIGVHHTYVMLNKPTGYVTTMSDDKGRKTVADLVTGVERRIYPVGRLDMDSEGLLLLTDDGELTNALTHPRHRIPKIYHVKVNEEVDKNKLAQLSSEMDIDGYTIAPVECHVIKRGEDGTTVEMILFEGRNRQIRKMCEKCELTVRRLKRVAIGELELDVARGKWRYLDKDEIDYLKEACAIGEKSKKK